MVGRKGELEQRVSQRTLELKKRGNCSQKERLRSRRRLTELAQRGHGIKINGENRREENSARGLMGEEMTQWLTRHLSIG